MKAIIKHGYSEQLIEHLKSSQQFFLKIKAGGVDAGIMGINRELAAIERLQGKESVFGKILIYPMLSYGYYVQNLPEQALNYENMSIELNADIPEHLSILQIHKVQQTLNVCRIYTKIGRIKEALSLAQSLAVYMLNGQLPDSYSDWSYAYLSAVPLSIRDNQLREILDEIVVLQIKCAEAESNEQFDRQLGSLFAGYPSRDSDIDKAIMYLALKNQYHLRDNKSFLQQLSASLDAAIRMNDIQRFSLLLDALRALKATYPEPAEYIAQKSRIVAQFDRINLNTRVRSILQVS